MRRWVVAYASACAGVFIFLGRGLISLAGASGDEMAHAVAAMPLVYSRPALTQSEWMPLMISPYNGALKAFFLAAVFRSFGSSVEIMRWTTLSLGALALIFMILLAAELFGMYLAALLGIIMAVDPALILAACYDRGPAVATMLYENAGLWLLALWWRDRGGRGRLTAAGFLFGLALWDKTHFLWFLFALPLAVALFAGKELRRRIARGDMAAGLSGLILGCAPLLVFNIVRPFCTFTHSESRGWSLAEHVPRIHHWIFDRLDMARQALSATSQYQMVAGVVPQWKTCWDMDMAGWGVALAALLLASSGRSVRRATFWLALTGAVFLASCLTPYPVMPHHYLLLYPWHYFFLASLMSGVLENTTVLNRHRHLWLLPLAAAALLRHGLLLTSFNADVRETGGGPMYRRFAIEMVRWLDQYHRAHPEARFWEEIGMPQAWLVGAQGRVEAERLPQVVYSPFYRRDELRLLLRPFQWPEIVILRYWHPSDHGALDSLRIRRRRIAVFYDRADGAPQVAAERLDSPVTSSFLRAGAAYQRGNLAPARRFIRDGLRSWAALPRDTSAKHPPLSLEFFFQEIRNKIPFHVMIELLAEIDRQSSGLGDEGMLRSSTEKLRDETIQKVTALSASAVSDWLDLTQADLKPPELGRLSGFWIGQAELASRTGNEELLRRSLVWVEKLHPRPEDLRRLAALYKKRGELGRALKILNRLTVCFANDAGFWIEQGVIAYQLGYRLSAQESIARANRLNPSDDERHEIAIYDQDRGRCDLAVKILDGLIKRNPNRADWLGDRGLCEQLIGSSDLAIRDLKAAIVLNPNVFSPYLTLGAIYTAKGDLREAVNIYDRALKAPGNANDPLRRAIRDDRNFLAAKMAPREP